MPARSFSTGIQAPDARRPDQDATCAAQLDRASTRPGLTKNERVIDDAAVGARRGRRPRAEVLNLCANNYLGLADHPRSSRPRTRRSTAGATGLASVRFICGTQAIHKAARGAARRIPRHRGHDPLSAPASTRTAGSSRPLLDERGRGDLRCAQPRLDHRRHPPLQGAPVPLREQRHGRARGAAAGGRRRALPADRDRRCLLDGRLRRPPARHLRPRRALRRAR